MKEDNKNKLKQFVKKHELAFAIAGGAVIFVAGAGLMYLGFRGITDIKMKDLKRIAGKNKNVDSLLEICDAIGKGTAGHTIETLTAPVTVAEFFGEHAECFIDGSRYQLDDTVATIIYSIAKKAET